MRGGRSVGFVRRLSGRARFAAAIWMVVASAGLVGQGGGPPDSGAHDSAAQKGLTLVNLDLLDSRDGFVIPPDSQFFPGETVHVYFQIKGYQVSVEERVLLTYRLDALDPDGRRFYRAEGGRVDAELAPQDENWMPVVRYSPRIPEHAGGGTYSIHIAVRDELGNGAVAKVLPIAVDGDRVEAADELLIRDFGFEEAGEGPEPVFRPGSAIAASFFITGYEIRPDNTFDIESDAWVADAEGAKLFEFDSRGEAGSPEYPRLWLPARLELDLEPTIPAGRYTVVVRLRDRVGATETEQRYGFRIR